MLHLIALDWEKESIHRPAPVQNLSLPKTKGGHRRKISVVEMACLVFYRVLLRGLSCRTDSARIFPIRRKKLLTEKRTELRTEKRTEKQNLFSSNSSTEFFPEFSVCVFLHVRTVNATEKRPPKNTARILQKIHRGTAKSRAPMWQGWKPLSMPI